MQSPSILFSKTEGALAPAPIPASWILRGKPQARNRVLSRSQDRTSVTIVWECSAGSFDWFYEGEETLHVIEGSAKLTTAAGVQMIGPGSVVVFEAGSHARWDIDGYIRKLAIFRQPVPSTLGMVMRSYTRLRTRLSGHLAQQSPALAGA